MEKISLNREQLFVRNKYTVFSMGGTAALRSVNKIMRLYIFKLVSISRYVTLQLFRQVWSDPFISKLTITVELYHQILINTMQTQTTYYEKSRKYI